MPKQYGYMYSEGKKYILIPEEEFNKPTVVQKEWQIVKGKHPETGEVHKWIDESDDLHISNCINSKCEIHSVRRISDGEVFSVGDEVRFLPKHNYGSYKIDNFFVTGNQILVRSKDNSIVEILDHNLEKLPPPTTPTTLQDEKKEVSKKEFEWTDELVQEYCANMIIGKTNHPVTAKSYLEHFKASKQLNTIKPPLGLIPLWYHNEQRLNDIYAAIRRYQEVCKEIPKEWIGEMESLEAYINGIKKEKEQLNTTKEEEKETRDNDADDFLCYLVKQKEDHVKKREFETASKWRFVERKYRDYLKAKPGPSGQYISLEDIASDYIATQHDENKKQNVSSQPQNNKERIEVEEIWAEKSDPQMEGTIYIALSKTISEKYFPAIKQAIDDAINS